jgi:hypothetical protein
MQFLPVSELPNLDDLRQMSPGIPKTPKPVPATKCRRRDDACKIIKREISSLNHPADNDKHGQLLARSERKSWLDYLDSSGSDLKWLLNDPLLDISIDGAERAVSDLPSRWSPSATKASAGLMFQTENDLALAQLDPRNRKGAAGEDLFSRNFNWGLSLLNLPGRAGMDLSLGLSYNSLIYTRIGSEVVGDDAPWVEDSLPQGAIPGAEGGDGWTWRGSSPNPYSGTAYHQSNLATGVHQHFFTGATQTLQVNAGDRLYAYVYLDPANVPSQVLLQWLENGSWDHRAYWGANLIAWGTDGTESRRYMGPLPPAGQWVRLEVPASLVGLEGKTVSGMAFTLYGGRASWDKAGKGGVLITGSAIHFDLEQGNPAPGFRLGFPSVQRSFFNPQANKNAYLLIMPSGRAVELREVSLNVFESVDSSYLHLTYNPADNSMNLRPTDGTQMRLEFKGGEYKPTRIKDRNGNYITINYGAGSDEAEISTIIDTLGREITFNYDYFFHINSITQSWGGQTHTWATFGYGTQVIQTNFPGLSLQGVANGSSVSVLTQVGLADGSLYKFEYNTYGQVKTIRRQAPDSENPYGYYDRASTVYDLPADGSTPQSDCPRFTTRTDRAWEHWAGGPWMTTSTYGPAIPNGVEGFVTLPDGTLYKEFFATTGWQRGLTMQTETWSGGVKKKWTTLQWTQDNTGVSYQLNPRVVETNVYDDAGNRARTRIDYFETEFWCIYDLPGGPVCYSTGFGLPKDIYEYGNNGTTVLRRTHMEYVSNDVYINRRIIGLPSEKLLYDGNNNLFSKVDYRYDLGGTYQEHQGPPVRHNTTNYGPSFVQGRGNLNSMRRWDVTAPTNEAKASEYETGYNTSGSVIFTRDPLDHQTSISYADSFSDGMDERNTFAYPTEVTDPDNYSSTAKYNFDFGAVTRTQDPKEAVFTRTYDAIGRLERITNQVNGAYTRYEYTEDQKYVETYTTIKDLATEFYTATLFDGDGRVRAEAAEHPTSASGYRARFKNYDAMGRLYVQNNWAEVAGSDWREAAGDDAAGWFWTIQTYDWQGRPTVFTNQDGTTRSISYEGCGCAGGQMAAFTDEMGRRREQNFDILGRVWRERTYNWGGSNGNNVYSTTINTYNTRDQVTRVREFQGAGPAPGDESCPTGSCQETTMSYDGHGRMSTRKHPIESATSSFVHNPDDTLQTMTDARGVTTTYGYNNRHLKTSITYGTAPDVIPLNPVTFGYDEVGNRLWMDDQPGRVDYHYNTLSQMEWEERRFDDLTQAYRLSYEYNLAGKMKKVTTPWNHSNTYVFNKAGEITDVTGTGYRDAHIPGTMRDVSQFATGVKYRAWGAVKSFTNGNFTVAEKKNFSMNYNSRLQLTHFNGGGRITDHTYYNDGRVKDVIDSTYSNFNRIHNYDHVGRLISANATTPFSHVYAYDVWDHATSRIGHHWGQPLNFTASYMSDRDQALTYDQAGNVTFTGTPNFATIQYDAASRQARRRSRPPGYLVDVIITKSYDGDGELVQSNREAVNILRQYLLRSTVMKGAIIVYFHPQGGGFPPSPSQTNIYLHGETIAHQVGVGDHVVWEYRNPIIRSYYAHYRMDLGGPLGEEDQVDDEVVVDPTGADVGITDPYSPEPPPPSDPAIGETVNFFGNPTEFRVACTVDGIEMPCDEALRYLNYGIAQLDLSRSNLNALIRVGIIPVQTKTYQPGENGEPGSYEVGYSFNFVQPNKSWYERNNIPIIRDYYMGYLNAARILAGDDERAKNCISAIASDKYTNPLALLNTIKIRKGNAIINEMQLYQGKPRAAAVTTGTGPDAKIRFYAPYFSNREGEVIRVDDKRVILNGVQMRAKTWLHELSHATGRYDHPNEQGRISSQYQEPISDSELDELIYKNCIKGAKLNE